MVVLQTTALPLGYGTEELVISMKSRAAEARAGSDAQVGASFVRDQVCDQEPSGFASQSRIAA